MFGTLELGGGGIACIGSYGKILTIGGTTYWSLFMLLLFVYCITVSVWFGQFSIVAVRIVMLTIVVLCCVILYMSSLVFQFRFCVIGTS